MSYKTLIVDDEPLAREGLRFLLAKDPEFILSEAKSGWEAVEMIRSSKPDLVFLDVQMPDIDGLTVLGEIGPDALPEIVFVTAYDRYAIQAFEMNAIDYLLKPIIASRFAITLDRIKNRLLTNPDRSASQEILSLLQTIAAPKRHVQRIAIRSLGKTAFVETAEIEWIEAAENYVELHFRNSRHLLHVSMNALEGSLDPGRFVRIHRSFIVNIEEIKELEPIAHGEYLVVLRHGTRLRSGRTYHSRLKDLAANPF